jgi:excisionase family DNA binding protein
MDKSPQAPLTLSVPEAGAKYFGLSKNGSYEAAARGHIPVVRIGRLLRVPVRALERMLDEASVNKPAA